jgi:hypothetical protein
MQALCKGTGGRGIGRTADYPRGMQLPHDPSNDPRIWVAAFPARSGLPYWSRWVDDCRDTHASIADAAKRVRLS